MVTTRSSSKKIQSLSRTEKENDNSYINSSYTPYQETCSKNDSSTEKTGNKLTRELAALGVITHPKRTPKKNLDFEMFSSMNLNVESTDTHDTDKAFNLVGSVETESLTRKEESLENISYSFSESCSIQGDREYREQNPRNTFVFDNRKGSSGVTEIGYKRPTASWKAKEKAKVGMEEESTQGKVALRERNRPYRTKPTNHNEAHYMMPTVSTIAKRVLKRPS